MSIAEADMPMDHPFATIGFALKTAQHALRTHMDASLQQIGLTTAQYAALNFLKIEPGASNALLARRSFVTPQTMQAIVVALERAGLITRAPHPGHGRVQTTELTDRGREALIAASEIVASTEDRLRNAAVPLEPRTVAAMLLRFAEAFR